MVLEEDLDTKHPMLDYARHNINSWIDRQDWERNDLWSKTSLLKSEWVLVRTFSRFIKHYLNIEIEVNKLN